MLNRRTDLAAEALDLAKKSKKKLQELPGIHRREREENNFAVTEVEIQSDEGAALIGKPKGRYITMDLASLWHWETGRFSAAAEVLAKELSALMPERCETVLAVGLGNAAMTADAVGPLSVKHILPTRHLRETEEAFRGLPSLSVLAAEVVGKTGIEAAEQIRALAEKMRPDAVLLIDALAARSIHRLCSTVQLSDTGLVPGSGVGNHRMALNRETLGAAVIAVGVPTVVEGATLAMDLLEEAGAELPEAHALRTGLFVTPKEIDERVKELSRLIGWGINAAVLGLSPEESAALLG